MTYAAIDAKAVVVLRTHGAVLPFPGYRSATTLAG